MTQRSCLVVDDSLVVRKAARRTMLARCQQLIDTDGNYPEAAQQVRALMFVARFSGDIDRRREQLGQ